MANDTRSCEMGSIDRYTWPLTF